MNKTVKTEWGEMNAPSEVIERMSQAMNAREDILKHLDRILFGDFHFVELNDTYMDLMNLTIPNVELNDDAFINEAVRIEAKILAGDVKRVPGKIVLA